MCTEQRVLLVNPPLWYYHSVPPDLIYAAAALRSSGWPVTMRDLNQEAFASFLSPADVDSTDPDKGYRVSDHHVTEGFHRGPNPDRLKNHPSRALQDPQLFFHYPNLLDAYEDARVIFEEESYIYAPARISWSAFESPYDNRSYRQVFQAVEDARTNPFFTFFGEIAPSLLDSRPTVLAISVFHPDQIIPTFTLLSLLREAGLEAHVTVFGSLEDQINTHTLIHGVSLAQLAVLAEYIDSIILADFDSIARELMERITSSRSLIGIPGVISLKEKYASLDIRKATGMWEADPTCVLEELPQALLAPSKVVNVVLSRGCYWGRCRFCSIQTHHGYGGRLDSNLERTLDLLEVCSRLSSVEVVRLRDCCLHPDDLRALATGIIRKGIKINWSCRTRLEAGFTPDLCSLLHSAGCLMLSFGMETFHPRILRAMCKGISPQRAVDTIKMCSDAGLGVKLTLMVGYPSETYQEAMHSQEIIMSLEEYLVRINYNRFLLFANTPIARSPAAWGMRVRGPTEDEILYYRMDFEMDGGMTPSDLDELEQNMQVWQRNLPYFESEDHLLLYLSRLGLSDCRTMAVDVNGR